MSFWEITIRGILSIPADCDLSYCGGALAVGEEVWLPPWGVLARQVPHVYLPHLVPQDKSLVETVQTEPNVPNVAVCHFESARVQRDSGKRNMWIIINPWFETLLNIVGLSQSSWLVHSGPSTSRAEVGVVCPEPTCGERWVWLVAGLDSAAVSRGRCCSRTIWTEPSSQTTARSRCSYGERHAWKTAGNWSAPWGNSCNQNVHAQRTLTHHIYCKGTWNTMTLS